MAIVLNGSTGIQNVLGSASAPADTNTTTPTTGIYYPSATTWGVSTAGTNALYIDASQNVGIGTTSPSTYTNSKLASYAATGDVWNSTDAAAATAGSGFHFYNNGVLRGEINTGGSSFSAWGGANSFNILGFANAPMTFATNSAERMRIDSSGNLLVGTTSFSITPSQGYTFYNATNSTLNIGHANGVGSGNNYMIFAYNSTSIGGITQNGTTGVLYNVTSDQRLKTNIINAPSASSIIDAIQIRSFDWKSDGSHYRYGVIAQELNEIVPEAVHTPVDEKEMMGVDYSKLVPHLIKYVQELKAEFDAYKAAHP